MGDKYIFTNITGSYVFSSTIKPVDKVSFRSLEEYNNKSAAEARLLKKYPNAKQLPAQHLSKMLSYFKETAKDFRAVCMELSKEGLRHSVSEDNFILQAVANIAELDRAMNLLARRLREWYAWHNPEFSRAVQDNRKFAELVRDCQDTRKEDSTGAEIGDEHISQIRKLAAQVCSLYLLKDEHEGYLNEIMKAYCPNLLEVAGTLIGAKLIEHAGSLRRLARCPAGTLQLLGAEKALFRHMKTSSRVPKHGLIIAHPAVAGAKNKGKASRILADKLAIAVKVDYYKGEFVGNKLKKEVEEKCLKA